MKWMGMLAVLFAVWIGLSSVAAAASPVDSIVESQAEHIPTGEVDDFWQNLMKQYGGFFPDSRTPSFMEMIIPGGRGLSLSDFFQGLGKFFFHEVIYNGKLLASIIILTVFSALLQTLQGAFEKHAVSQVAYSIAYMVLIIIAINSFSVAIGYARSAITGMIDFMMAMIPLLLTILTSMGNVTTATVMHPLIVFMIHTVGTLIYAVVFPLLFFSTVLHIVSSLSDKYKVTQLANLLRSISVAMLGILLTIFLGVVSVQGATASVTDGVSMRTAKYVTGNFVPIVGTMFSDAADTVISASLLVKNAVGLAGVIIIILLCAFPAIKILTLALIYNLSAAIMQPLGENPIVNCLEMIGKNMIYVFAAMASVGLMFFLALTIMIATGNLAMMMR